MAAINITIEMLAPLELHDLSIRPVLGAAMLKGRLRAECTLIAMALGLRVCGGHRRAAMCYTERCPICQLFGGPWRAGMLYFEDLRADKPAALDRRVGGIRGRGRGVLLSIHETQYDLLPAGSKLTGTIRYDFAPLWPLALTVLGLRAISSVGGGRSAGHGLCRVDALPFDRNGQPITDAALAGAIQAYLAEQRAGSDKPPAAAGAIGP